MTFEENNEPLECKYCGETIDEENEKYVILATYNISENTPDSEVGFHFQCWEDYFKICVQNKIDAIKEKTIKKVKEASEGFCGSNLLKGILSSVHNLLGETKKEIKNKKEEEDEEDEEYFGEYIDLTNSNTKKQKKNGRHRLT